MDNIFLKYGDLIVLYSEVGQGFLQSQGFTNPDVFLQTQPRDSLQLCRNYRDFIFRVLPRLNYEARKDYEEFSKFLKNKHKQAKEGKGEKPSTLLKKQLKIYEKKMLDEEEINKEFCQMKQGEWVTYGNEVQLEHYDSKGFICTNDINCKAKLDKSIDKVILAATGSPSIYFKVMPCYKFRQEGEKVIYGDQIFLLNVKANLYLANSYIQFNQKSNVQETSRKLEPPEEDWRPLDADRREDPGDFAKRYEMSCSTTPTRFQPLCHTQENQESMKKFLKGNCVVRLQHTELGGYLTSDDLDFTEDGLAEVYVRCYTGEDNNKNEKELTDIEQYSSGDLFELELAKNLDRGKICEWSSTKDQENKTSYRLRHFNSGRLVKIQDVMMFGKQLTTLGLGDHISYETDAAKAADQLDKSLFNLLSTTVDSDNSIRTGNSLKLQHASTKYYLSTKGDKEWTEGVQGGGGGTRQKSRAVGRRPKARDSIDNLIGEVGIEPSIKGTRNKGKRTGIYNPLDEDELYFSKNNVVELKKTAANDDVFMITLVEKKEMEDLLFVHTVGAQLYKYTTYLRWNKIHEIPLEMYHYVIYLLRELIFFVAETESDDPETAEGYPIKTRQKLMREQRIVELIVDCLYYPFVQGEYKIDELTDDMQMKKIVILCYRFLLHSVKDYRLNELYASQWIELFLDQSMAAADQNIKAETTIAVLVSNNKTLLQKQITRETIEKFINLCREREKDERFVFLLWALCSCMNEPIISNQNNIIELILEESDTFGESTRDALLLPVEEEKDEIRVEVEEGDESRWIALKDLKDYSFKHDKYRLYKYYTAFIDLMAEMCLQRNHRALGHLDNVYTLSIVYKAICSPNLDSKMKSKFMRLMYNMYIDREPYEDLQVPNLTRVWTEISLIGNKIQRYRKELPEYINNMKRFVLEYLKDTGGVQVVYKKEDNVMTLEVIKLTKCMISYGFYKTKEELREISLSLISLLNGIDDVYSRKDEASVSRGLMTIFKKIKSKIDDTEDLVERYQRSEGNLIIMRCKQYI